METEAAESLAHVVQQNPDIDLTDLIKLYKQKPKRLFQIENSDIHDPEI